VEHMEKGVEEWCRLEYRHICQLIPPERLLFLHWPEGEDPADLAPAGAAPPRTWAEGLQRLKAECGAASTAGSSGAGAGTAAAGAASPAALPAWDRICLLDMDAEEALEPHDCTAFDAVVFGGILGNIIEREDGTYGSDDRTSELRKLGFAHRRHLREMQMTTDTAVLVTRCVMEEARSLAEIPFMDSPEIEAPSTGERGVADSVCMEGFRYVARRGGGGEWEPTLPEGMRELLTRDADKDILGSL